MKNVGTSISASTGSSRRRRAHPEDDMQRALIQWITLATPRIPQLALAFAVPNGMAADAKVRVDRRTGKKVRYSPAAARMKGLGLRPGVPDILIPGIVYKPHPDAEDECITYTGLAIELKAGKNKPTPEQLDWHKRLDGVGWLVRVCYSFDEARQTIADYFGVKP